MDSYIGDDEILRLIGDGTESDVECESDGENKDEEGYVQPRIPVVEEEVIQDDTFLEQLNNLDTVGDVIEAVVRGEIGLEPPDNAERHANIFDCITNEGEIRWEKTIFTTRYPPAWDYSETHPENVETPLQYFFRYIPKEFFESAANFTNIYAIQQDSRFKPCLPEELETLFGLHIAMGTLAFPRARMYWNQSLGLNLFLDNMTRDRFFSLRTHLHFINNLERPQDCKDVFYKVRPIFDVVRNRCLQLDLTRELSVDEQMIPFTGKMKAKQFVKGKPDPWGIKNFVICGTNGLAYDFLLYQGKTTEVDPDLKEFGVGASVVLKLCERINKKGHILFFDNYFNSYHLLQILKSKEIFAGGTARVNRFHKPPLLDNKEMKKQERGYAEECVSEDGDVAMAKWQDKKSVLMASNFLSIGECDVVKRWDKVNSCYVNVSRPEVIKEYNETMGGVDLLNRLISFYRIKVRSKKWPLKLTFHAVDLAVTNAWLEYKMDCQTLNVPKKDVLDLLNFRLNVAIALTSVGKTISSKKRGRPASLENDQNPTNRKKRNESRPMDDIKFDTVDHLPVHDDKEEPTRCKNTNCGKFRSHWFCQKCQVHLCMTKNRNCFFSFHKK